MHILRHCPRVLTILFLCAILCFAAPTAFATPRSIHTAQYTSASTEQYQTISSASTPSATPTPTPTSASSLTELHIVAIPTSGKAFLVGFLGCIGLCTIVYLLYQWMS